MAASNNSLLANANTPQLADSLESALIQFNKLAASVQHPVTVPNPSNAGRGFDEWLANDLQYGALLVGDETPPITTASPYSFEDESPLLKYETVLSITPVPSLFERPNTFQSHPCGMQGLAAQEFGLGPMELLTPHGLTTSRLQQAAAALKIPWSQELKTAVLEQTKKLPLNIISSIAQEGILSSSQSSTATAATAMTMATATSTAKIKAKTTAKRPCSIDEEEPEEILAKRAKNTDAARRSRLKKLIKLEGLEAKVAELETIKRCLNTRVAVLETEKNGFLIKQAEQNARIAQLEAKIMEAHLALKTRDL
ncbi:hypothetical protein BX616_001286 [Lobosporangium transversale]|uniref:BZIP domain-containing protein n=1 Tax=Lobosporangium transversale TaxID=64571 RepID=A0A1Y2GP80_9FUNG|nr:hypothetical protein BCR41DRAFT_355494 [Lobosporangium transversale]KAF9917343.1 hypothetical protein BX616_001286 [Lobosporangium transversale]ORZ13352.1 hypothetical protein BCR41DRAFT_355494 [Lobosporangium transversale]|eukprot:XP_021880433.1 hypothetical protein BCR41DRAFT_355494 [Lobosporangium transversale]